MPKCHGYDTIGPRSRIAPSVSRKSIQSSAGAGRWHFYARVAEAAPAGPWPTPCLGIQPLPCGTPPAGSVDSECSAGGSSTESAGPLMPYLWHIEDDAGRKSGLRRHKKIRRKSPLQGPRGGLEEKMVQRFGVALFISYRSGRLKGAHRQGGRSLLWEFLTWL